MSLVFYGCHDQSWMKILNDKLLPSLQSTIQINTIHNCHTYSDELKMKYDYILPLMESNMLELHHHNIKAMMSNLDSINAFMYKNLFSDYVIKYNLTDYVPITYKSINEIPPKKLLIIKPYNLNAGTGIYLKCGVDEEDFNEHVVQEYLEGNKEYCAHIVANKGKIELCITYEYEFKEFLHVKRAINSDMILYKVQLDAKYIDCLESFLLPCLYNGVCNINFKICDDVVKVFEINPRLGGSLMFPENREDLIEIIKTLIIVFT